jgi:hypothetical protein
VFLWSGSGSSGKESCSKSFEALPRRVRITQEGKGIPTENVDVFKLRLSVLYKVTVGFFFF